MAMSQSGGTGVLKALFIPHGSSIPGTIAGLQNIFWVDLCLQNQEQSLGTVGNSPQINKQTNKYQTINF